MKNQITLLGAAVLLASLSLSVSAADKALAALTTTLLARAVGPKPHSQRVDSSLRNQAFSD